MPKAMYAIWWDNTLGPLVGRSTPDGETLSSDEALAIFLGHGVNHEARVGYTNLGRGLIVSIMESPNCLAVLLDDSDDPQIVERSLTRLIGEIDLNSQQWDRQIEMAFKRLLNMINCSSTEQLLARPDVTRLVTDLRTGRIEDIRPRNVMKQMASYPTAKEYINASDTEIEHTLADLVIAGVLIPKTYGRRIQCRQCGSDEVEIVLVCPTCNSKRLETRYALFCPNCNNRTEQIIYDDISEVVCEHCGASISVTDLVVINVEISCLECGRASVDTTIILNCASCGRRMNLVDILGGTGLKFSLR